MVGLLFLLSFKVASSIQKKETKKSITLFVHKDENNIWVYIKYKMSRAKFRSFQI